MLVPPLRDGWWWVLNRLAARIGFVSALGAIIAWVATLVGPRFFGSRRALPNALIGAVFAAALIRDVTWWQSP
jgi:hypothetical protein